MTSRLTPAAGLLTALVVSAAGCQCGPVDPGPDAGDPDAGAILPIDAGPDPVDDAGATCRAPLRDGVWLATQLEGPRQLAWDGTHLYFTEQGAFPAGYGRLSRVDLQGRREILVDRLNTPDAVAVDDEYIYVLDGRLDDPTTPVTPPSPGLWRLNKVSLQAVQLALLATDANRAGGTELAVTAEHVLIASGLRWLMRVRKDASELPFTLYTAPEEGAVTAVAVDGADVYFLVRGTGQAAPQSGLYRTRLDGSAAAARVSSEPLEGDALLVTPDAFFWSENRPAPTGRIRALSRIDGGTIDLASGLDQPASLARVDADTVYFQQATNPSPYAGASVEFLLWNADCASAGIAPVGPSGFGPGDLVVDGDQVFFSSAGAAGLGAVGVLRRD